LPIEFFFDINDLLGKIFEVRVQAFKNRDEARR
jgi:hypothetical protein